jgi:hypothetical protein
LSRAAASFAAVATLVAVAPAHAADLEVAFSDHDARVPTNGVATYWLQVDNRADAPAHDVVLRFAVPGGLRFDGGRPPGCSRGQPLANGYVPFECPLGRIKAGGGAESAVNLVAPERPARLTVPAHVSGRDPEARPADNWAAAATRVVYARGRCANSFAEETFGDDRLVGGPFGDELFGLPGDDVLVGLDGPDCLYGNGGDDRVLGGGGRDLVEGGVGDDVLRGRRGRDRYLAAAGDDMIRAGDGIGERVQCGPGVDVAVVDRFDRTRDCEAVLVRAP